MVIVCECGTKFATEAGHAEHKRRLRCRGPPREDDGECKVCFRSFKTYAGMRQHMRKAHPALYNIELEQRYEGDDGRLPQWTDEDDINMAKLEFSYSGNTINQFLLSVYPERNINFIKYRRKRKEYIEFIESLREEERLNRPAEQEEPEVFLSTPELQDEAAAFPAEPLVPSSPDQVRDPNVVPDTRLNPEVDEFVPQGYDPQASISSFLREYWLRNERWNEEDRNLYNFSQMRNVDRHRERVRLFINNYISSQINNGSESTGKRGRRTKALSAPVFNSRNQERAYRYRITQFRYRKDRAALARAIIDDKPLWGEDVHPDITRVDEKYRSLFESRSPLDDEPVVKVNHDLKVGRPFTEGEVIWALKTSKSQSAGPDGLRLNRLRRVPLHRLVLLYNVMFLFGVVPDTLKRNKTILIPKSGDDPLNVDNWRPLTISSILVRVMHRILGRRLSQLPMHDHQRGFRKVDGVLLNNLSLQTLVKERRRKLKEYDIISIDLRQAFDSVSQGSILRAMNRFGLDEVSVRYIMDTYYKSSTRVSVGNGTTKKIDMTRGVKQGDPISPYLFNLVVDELICELEREFPGLPISDHIKLTVLGYADDLILLASSTKDANKMLRHTVEFFKRRGMAIHPNKSVAISNRVNRGNKHMYSITRPLYFVDGVPIKQLKPAELFKYLGRKYDLMGQTRVSVDELHTQLIRIQTAALKPQQKIEVIKTYLLPRYIDKLQSPIITMKTLKSVDKAVRIAVRKILHLNKSCADAFLHAPIKEGGLGIMCMSLSVPATFRRRLTSLLALNNIGIAGVLSLPYAQKLWSKLMRWTNTNGGSSEAIARLLSEQLDAGYSGNGLRQGACHEGSGNWLHNPPPYWSGQDYIKAVQLRGNLLPTRGIPSNPPHERKCRMGCERNESLSHVLQKCPKSHYKRIQRHDQIVTFVRKVAEKKGWIVEVEPRVRCTNGVLKKPDLICRMGNRVVVCDVAVSWEGSSPLSHAAQNKFALYSEPTFIEAMTNRYPGDIIVVAPLIVGARGIWCPENASIQHILGLSRQDIRHIITLTIQGSIAIHRLFMSL